MLLPIAPGVAPMFWATLLFLAPTAYLTARWSARGLRRLLPLATLLELSLHFPDAAPERFVVWREIRTERELAARITHAQQHGVGDDPGEAAVNILALAAALSLHDRRTRGHSERVRVFADMIGEQLRLDDRDRDRLRWASLLHDVGKIVVPAEVLNRSEPLTDGDWERIRTHPRAGADLAGPLKAWFGDWIDVIAQHHERWDGTGYPRGLAGDGIFVGARIVAVADAFEVMTAPRPYQPAIGVREAREELVASAGTHFDPDVVRAFLEISLGRLRRRVGVVAALLQALPLGGQVLRSGLVPGGFDLMGAFDPGGGHGGAGHGGGGHGGAAHVGHDHLEAGLRSLQKDD